MKLKYITLCPTNKSALIIDDAMTLHKFSNKFKSKSTLSYLNIDYIFVDEISMVHEIFYKFLLVIKRLKPNIKFIISGDFGQLSPVCDRFDGEYCNSQALHELCGGNRLILTTCRRASSELYNICLEPSKVNPSDFGNAMTDFHLCYTNKTRIKINKMMMKKMAKKYKVNVTLPAKPFCPNSQDVKLIGGCNMPIIAYKNNSKLDIVNNEMFTINNIDDKFVYFSNSKKKDLSVEVSKFQDNFYVGYAITIHKSQGSTFDYPYTIHEWNTLDDKLKYVALSRATNKNLINII